VGSVLLALLFLPAVLASAYVLVRMRVRPRVLAESAAAAPSVSGDPDPIAALDVLLADLEQSTLDERDAAELEQLAERLEAATALLEGVG